MTTYYVRKSGNDGNGGLLTTDAWLTVDHAANQVAAGDLVHIGSGIYREQVTMDTPGTAGNEIEFRGDPTGEYTGDSGIVIITAHNANNAGAARASCWEMGIRAYIIVRNIIFDGGTSYVVGKTGGIESEAWRGCIFDSCVFCGGHDEETHSIGLHAGWGETALVLGLQFYDCIFFGEVHVTFWQNPLQHYNVEWDFENCIFFGRPHPEVVSRNAIYIENTGGADTYSICGIDMVNCTVMGSEYPFVGDGLLNAAIQCRVVNNLIYGSRVIAAEFNSVNNTIFEDYNKTYDTSTSVTGNVQRGGNSSSGECPLFFGAFADMMYRMGLGWSPWLSWVPTDHNPAIDFASAAYAPATDMLDNPRPMMRNVDDAGAAEARARPLDETGMVYSGTHAFRFEGAGFQDFRQEVVTGTPITVTVYGRYDGNYAGSLPILRVMDIEGQADQSDVMVGGAGTWEELSIVVNPTVTGFCRLRIESRDTSANGECYFDLLQVV